MPRTPKFVPLAGMLLAAWAASAHSAAAAEDSAPKIDPRAQRVIEQLSARFDRVKSFQVDVTSSMIIEAQSSKNDITTHYKISGARPNLLAIRLTAGETGATVVCDGKQLFTYAPGMERYTLSAAPATLEAILHDGMWRLAQMGNAPTFAALVLAFRHPQHVMQGITAAEYLGEEQVAGASCHHLNVAQGPIDLALWVATGEHPVLRKVVPDMRRSLKAEGAVLPPGLKISLVGTFDHWQFDRQPEPDAFAFIPPKDAEKVTTLIEDAHVSGHEPQQLLGRPAPPFSLKTPEGTQVRLADLLEAKKIVVLDFWATWCAPCVEGLPRVAEVVARFKHRGVVFYAINQEEDADTIHEFLKRKQLDLPVLMDTDNEISDEYKAELIPLTVIISPDGRVQAAHFGVSKDAIAHLEQQLSDLLAGKRLVEDKPEKD
jgi:peroxiredoxin